MKNIDPSKSGNQMNAQPQRFQTLVFKRLFLTALGLAALTAFIYSYLQSVVVKDFYLAEGSQATENLAQLSELALLYESGENARDAATATLQFPSIKHVAIISEFGDIIYDDGSTNDKIHTSLLENYWSGDNANMISSSRDTLQFAAPVYTVYEDEKTNELALGDEELTKKYLGYVVVQIDAAKIRDLQYKTFIRNFIVGLIYGVIFALIISYILARQLKPLITIAKTMSEAKEGEYKQTPIDDKSALEIQQISSSYNEMISRLADRDQRLRGQRDLLETEVALRTSELIQARDAALEANKHKSEFLANVTHELRTPLQSILGYSELIAETLADEGIDDCDGDLEKISNNSQHLLGLINSILDISKIEAGKMDLNIVEMNFGELIKNLVATITPLANKNHNELIVKTTNIEQPAFCDDRKIFQILLNLLSNAAKFTNNGKITLDLSIRDEQLTCIVRDNGIGIDETMQTLIFEPFRQVDGSESRKYVGTGLGLSITLRLTELLGGTLKLQSAPEIGSTFTVSLPVMTASDARRYG